MGLVIGVIETCIIFFILFVFILPPIILWIVNPVLEWYLDILDSVAEKIGNKIRRK